MSNIGGSIPGDKGGFSVSGSHSDNSGRLVQVNDNSGLADAIRSKLAGKNKRSNFMPKRWR